MKNPTSKFLIVASAALVMCAFTAGRSSAQIPAYTTSGTETDDGGYGISGFEFTLSKSIDVTDLGFTALSLGGGDTPHVTLWSVGPLGALTQLDDTGNILSSVHSTPQGSGTGEPSFVTIPTKLLTAGGTYLVTAPAYWESTFASPSGITDATGVFSSTSFLTQASGGWINWDNSSYFGSTPNLSSLKAAPAGTTPTAANFEFNVVATMTPEPSTYVMMGMGLTVLAVLARRRSLRA